MLLENVKRQLQLVLTEEKKDLRMIWVGGRAAGPWREETPGKLGEQETIIQFC